MVWPTLGSRTAKEQNRTVCVPRNNAGAAHWRAAEASAHNVAVSSVANPFVAVSLPAHLWMRWMHLLFIGNFGVARRNWDLDVLDCVTIRSRL